MLEMRMNENLYVLFIASGLKCTIDQTYYGLLPWEKKTNY